MIMKKNLFLSLLALIISMPMFADVVINATNFPDANFRQYLLTNKDPRINITSGKNNFIANESGINGFGADGILTTNEIKYICGMTLENVANLKGIEYFTGLKYLKCTGVTTGTVNLSSNNDLHYLDLQGSFTSMILSSASANKLYALKLDAPNLTSFNFSGYTNLTWVRLDNMRLSSLDFSNLASDMSNPYNRPALTLGIFNPQVVFNLIKPTTTTEFYLELSNTKQTSLDLSDFWVTELTLKNNSSMTTLTLPTDKTKMLNMVIIGNPLLTSLNVDGCTALEGLIYRDNGFKSVDVTKNTALKLLECYGNGLTSLDVSNNTELKFLYCHNNLLTSLDLSKNTDLRALECYINQMTELDLSNNTYLRSEVVDESYTGDKYINKIVVGYSPFIIDIKDINNYNMGDVEYNARDFVTRWEYVPSISLSPQTLSKDYVAIDDRSKLGVQCNTKNGILTSYGSYSAVTSSDDNNNYIVVGDGTSDVHGYNNTLKYNYNTGYTGTYNAAKTMAVNIGTSAHGMYIHPETLRGSDNFYSGTLYLEFPARIPAGVQCYYAKGLDANEDLVGLTEVTGTIPANTAVIVKAPSKYKFFAFNESDETPAAPTDNIIEGTIEGLSVTPLSVLTLGHNTDRSTGEYDNFGFWNYRGNWINPFRAYIPKSSLAAGAKNGFSLVFPEDGTTGIARLTNSDTAEDGTWYTLSGIRLTAKPTAKGIYVNKGQKVVIR